MDKNKIQQQLLESMKILIQEEIKKLKITYIIEGVVQKQLSSNLYEILYNKEIYSAKVFDSKVYNVNDVVDVLVRNGDFSEKIILWKVR